MILLDDFNALVRTGPAYRERERERDYNALASQQV